MIDLDTTTDDAIHAPVKGVVYLVEMDFKALTARFNTSSEDMDVDGHTYIGRGQLVDFPTLVENEAIGGSKATFGFSIVSTAMKAAVIGDSTQFRLRPIRVYLQLTDEKFRRVGSKKLRWRGYMDKISVEKAKTSDNYSGKIRLECMRPGLSRMRRYEGLRVTHQQHIINHPTDRGLEYLQGLINTPIPWLSVEFQKQ